MRYSELLCVSLGKVSYVGFLSGDGTSSNLTRARESDVKCGHSAIVCPDSESVCCVSLGQRHSKCNVIQKLLLSVSCCTSVTAVKVLLLLS
jgi:hypothetical protein